MKPNSSIADAYDWTDNNRLKRFKSWEAEIAHMQSLGYKLVPPDYHIPHWSTAMAMGDALPKLYVLRNGGPDELSTHFDRPARQLCYPVFFRANEQVEEHEGDAPKSCFDDLRAANLERQEEWCPDLKPDLSFRGNELGGECGEAQNVIKKLERERHGWRGSKDTVEHLAEELADVVIVVDLIAAQCDIDLSEAVAAKFNATSVKNGLAARMPSRNESAHGRAPQRQPDNQQNDE